MTPTKKPEPEPVVEATEEPAPVEAAPEPPPAPAAEMEVWQEGVKAHTAERAAAAAAAEVKATTSRAPKKRRKPAWRETRWGTHAQSQCKFCHYSTFDLTAMAKHADAQHPEEE